MFTFFQDTYNYEDRKVSRDTSSCGIEVSTAYSSDEGYETALIDTNGTHPVERYETREDAVRGHYKWLIFAHDANGKTVNRLGGFRGLVKGVEILLEAP